MIDDRLKEWRKLSSIDYIRSPSRTTRGSGKLAAQTFSDRYFELMGVIAQLQGALSEACDVIETNDGLKDFVNSETMQKLLENLNK